MPRSPADAGAGDVEPQRLRTETSGTNADLLRLPEEMSAPTKWRPNGSGPRSRALQVLSREAAAESEAVMAEHLRLPCCRLLI